MGRYARAPPPRLQGGQGVIPRLRHRRARAYVRAVKRTEAYAARVGWNPQDPGNLGNLLALSRHESHAWGRLPEAARNAIQDWGSK